MTALVSLPFIAMIPIDCKITNFFLTLVFCMIDQKAIVFADATIIVMESKITDYGLLRETSGLTLSSFIEKVNT